MAARLGSDDRVANGVLPEFVGLGDEVGYDLATSRADGSGFAALPASALLPHDEQHRPVPDTDGTGATPASSNVR